MAVKKRPAVIDPKMFARGVRIETREHHLPMRITRKLVTEHLTVNPDEYKWKR